MTTTRRGFLSGLLAVGALAALPGCRVRRHTEEREITWRMLTYSTPLMKIRVSRTSRDGVLLYDFEPTGKRIKIGNFSHDPAD